MTCPVSLNLLCDAFRCLPVRQLYALFGSNGSSRGADSGSSDGNDGIVIGLSLALGLTLVVIGALAVWKFRVRKNARRLMEDMGDGDL